MSRTNRKGTEGVQGSIPKAVLMVTPAGNPPATTTTRVPRQSENSRWPQPSFRDGKPHPPPPMSPSPRHSRALPPCLHPAHHPSRYAQLASHVQAAEGVIAAVEAALNDGLGSVPQALDKTEEEEEGYGGKPYPIEACIDACMGHACIDAWALHACGWSVLYRHVGVVWSPHCHWSITCAAPSPSPLLCCRGGGLTCSIVMGSTSELSSAK